MSCIIIGVVVLIAIILLFYREFWVDNHSSLWSSPISKDEITDLEKDKKKEDDTSHET